MPQLKEYGKEHPKVLALIRPVLLGQIVIFGPNPNLCSLLESLEAPVAAKLPL